MKTIILSLMASAGCFAQQVDWVSQVRNKPVADTRQYNFSPQAQTSTIAGGSTNQAAHFAPCPLGVNGTDVAHYLYVSTVGTPEAVLITGGTCTAGAATGTVLFTPQYTHAAGWKIGSATGGLHEAILSGGTSAFTVAVTSPITMYAGIASWPLGGGVTIQGQGSASYAAITRAASFTSGDMFNMDVANQASFAPVTFQNLSIQQDANVSTSPAHTGAAIHGVNVPNVGFTVLNVAISNGYTGIRVKGTSLTADQVTMYFANPANYTPYAGIFVEGTGNSLETTNINLSNITVDGYPRGASTELQYGIVTTGCDGITGDNFTLSAKTSLLVNPTSPDFVTNTRFSHVWMDGPTNKGIQLAGTGLIIGLSVDDFYINQSDDTTSGNTGIGIGGAVVVASISNGIIRMGQYDAIEVGTTGTPNSIDITNVQITEGNRSQGAYTPAVYVASGQSNLHISGMHVANTATGYFRYGITATNATGLQFSNSSISLGVTGIAPVNLNGTNTGIVSGVIGLNDGVLFANIPAMRAS